MVIRERRKKWGTGGSPVHEMKCEEKNTGGLPVPHLEEEEEEDAHVNMASAVI